MKKTEEEKREKLVSDFREVETQWSLDGGYTFEMTHRDDADNYADIALWFAQQAVEERDKEIEVWIDENWITTEVGAATRLKELTQFLQSRKETDK